MKQQHFLLLVFVLLCGVFESCQKEIVADDIPNPVSVKLRTYIEDARNTSYNTIDTFDVNYDSQERIASLIGRGTGFKFLYSYQTSNYTTEIRFLEHLIIKDVSFLNGSGFVDSTFQYNDTGDSSTSKLTYSAKGEIIEERNYDYTLAGGSVLSDITTYVYDNNGNVITSTEKAANGQTIAVSTYTYNSFLNTVFLSPTNRPLYYKNLPATITVVSGGVTESVTYEYTYDSDQRVISEKGSYSDGTFVIKKYEYY